MKKVLLLGDSIRYGATGSPGYGGYVKEMLEDVAEVYAPDDNCRFAQYTQRHLYEWGYAFPSDIDVVHWNNGLWDLIRLHGEEPLTPCDMYVYFLERVYRMLKKVFPKAKIIFALTTGVVEEWAEPQFMRYNSDIEQYNKAAEELMKKLGVEVNDLYCVTKEFDNSLHCDSVHFGEEGSKILAEKVYEKIKQAL